MENPFLIGIAAWFVPGAGHIAQGRLKRGLIIGGSIWLMFIIAVFSGGAYYPGFGFKDGTLLFLLNIFAKMGKNRNTLQFTLDIFNLGNLITPKWGIIKTLNASSVLIPQNQNSLVPGGTVRPTFRLATANNQILTRTFRDNVSTTSTYSVQFGFRYILN